MVTASDHTGAHRTASESDHMGLHRTKLTHSLYSWPSDPIRPWRGSDPNRPTSGTMRRAISRSRGSVQVRCGLMWSDAV